MFQSLFCEYQRLRWEFNMDEYHMDLKIKDLKERDALKYDRAVKRVLEDIIEEEYEDEAHAIVLLNEKYCSSSSDEDDGSEERIDEYKRRLSGYDRDEWRVVRHDEWEAPHDGYKPHRITKRIVRMQYGLNMALK